MSENKYKKKLIEVAIPLEAINAASAREKSIRHGHPSTLHLWWARRPLAACRAVLFAQLVDDPSSLPDQFPTPEAQEAERKRLFAIIEDLVKWENSTNEEVLERARAEIRRSCGGELPPVYDPFSGGGSIPLEAQRLGLPAYGSDLNPVAVMIGKAMIEIPPKFKNMPPIHPGIRERSFYRNAEGLAEDVKHYGEWMREKAWERIGHLYPQVDLPKEYGGGKATVIAWIWTRTVPSPDPAFSDAQVPIASSFMLSTKKGQEAWVEPLVDKHAKTISFRVRTGGTKAELAKAAEGTKAGRGANFVCLMSGTAITPDYVKKKLQNKEGSEQMIAIVAEGSRRRFFVSPDAKHEESANVDRPTANYDVRIAKHPQYMGVMSYGFDTYSELYTSRQLTALAVFSQLMADLKAKVAEEAQILKEGDGRRLSEGGSGSASYADALAFYLGLAIDRVAMSGNSMVRWNPVGPKAQHIFGRQAISMLWDFAETNPFASATGSFTAALEMVANGLAGVPCGFGSVVQCDAQRVILPNNAVISTDPPYYDNVPYSDISDFFYHWLRQTVGDIFPKEMSTLATPKAEELVADRVRHGSAESAENFFMDGMRNTVSALREQSSDDFPATVYYAFKQSEVSEEGITSAGWASFLQACIESGYSIVGTWPMRTEMATRMRAAGSNALANSVVLVCRKKEATAETITRAEFIRSLKRELSPAIAELQAANIAPADMPQSAIGPGMGVFSRHAAVLESDDSPMSVKTALQLINRELDEYLGGIEGEFDADTRFAITWFQQNGNSKGDYGVADNLARARGISVESVKHAGIVESSAGKVRILTRDELDEAWEPDSDGHLTVWECLQHLVKAHEQDGISHDTAVLLKKIGSHAEAVKDLAYCLYDISANKRKDAKEATAYNALIADWTELTKAAAAIHDTSGDRQTRMDI